MSRKRPKRGRPRGDHAPGVPSRILDAAHQLFLQSGYRSSSIDDISELAPASKPTIYAHFPGKEALFAAVVSRAVDRLTDFENFTPQGDTIEEKLVSLGSAIVDQVIAESLGVMRATIGEAQRLPESSRSFHHAARDRSVKAVSRLLNKDALERPHRPKRHQGTAKIFLDLILLPLLFRALLGEKPGDLKNELPAFMRERGGFILAVGETA
ncbi:TetR/AcrR family transcriptional regulator [Bradyrhizobium sp. PMVTL-01]|uniref:TetR/AcrR family transcriptional regulator n=1 Tax=unclassified Bradyrhizobium TaxID=2631580 RepID=UPI003F704B52